MATLPIDFNTLNFFSALTNAKIFDDLSSAVGAYNVIDDHRILKEDDVETLIELGQNTPSLTGGSKTGVNVKSLLGDMQSGNVTATDTGSLSLVSAGTFTYALMNALGVNVTINDIIKDKVAQALTVLYGFTIGTAEANSYYIKTIIKDGVTYINDRVVKKLSDALYNTGLFTFTETQDIPQTTGMYNLTAGSYNLTSYLSTFFDECLEYGLSTGGTYYYNNFNTGVPYFANAKQNFIDYIVSSVGDNNYRFIQCNYNCSQRYSGLSYITHGFQIKLSNVDTADITNSTNTYAYGNYSGILYLTCYITYDSSTIITTRPNVYTSSFPMSNQIFIGTWYKYSTSYGSIIEYSKQNINSIGRAIEGIDIQIGANTPKDNDIDIQTNYPTWYNTGIDIGLYDKEANAIAQGRLLPIDVQAEDTLALSFTKAQAQAQAGAIAQEAENAITVGANEVLNSLVNAETGTKVVPIDVPTPVPQSTPTPSVITTVSSAGLATIYNPTEAQIQSLKGELWQEGVLDILKTLFANNPLDCIISLHRIYCTPSVDATTATIKLGYYQTSVSGVKVINNQYVTVDCGSINIGELYGNSTDYLPYTNVSIYLPFIGIRDLSANDVVGSSVNVIYRIDVTTGSCLAQIDVTKYGVKQTLYTFEGNCAVTVPLSSANALRLLGSTVATVASAMTGNVLGAIGGIAGSFGGINIQRSGNFGSNAGAMGIKKPYVIINRHIPYDASDYNKLYGYPSNKLIKLSTLTGFTRVKDVHVEGIACTDNEKILIENALKDGVLL